MRVLSPPQLFSVEDWGRWCRLPFALIFKLQLLTSAKVMKHCGSQYLDLHSLYKQILLLVRRSIVGAVLAVMLAFSLFVGRYAQAGEAQPESFVYDDKGRRDPLMKLVTAEGTIVSYDMDLLIADLTLEGIIFDPHGNSLAIINGKIVKVDDKIGLFVVLAIEQSRIILSKGQEKFVLELKKEE